MEPLFTNDAVVLGILMTILAVIFVTASSSRPFWKQFYRYVPALVLCYFIPAFCNWPLGLISPEWYDAGVISFFAERGISISSGAPIAEIHSALDTLKLESGDIAEFRHTSQLYYVASRYLLPACLILLCLSIDLKAVIGLGPKALIMFATATIGVVIGGPVALLVTSWLFPGVIEAAPDDIWRGLSTVAGSWIGGGANQTAMKEIFDVGDNLFGTMIVIDVVVANIWMACLLYGASISDRLDVKLKADNSAIERLKQQVSEYRAKITQMPTTTSTFVLMAVAFGGTAVSHLGADLMTPWMERYRPALEAAGMHTLMEHFFWLIVIATTIGLGLSFTRARKLEGVGASRWGSIFIYVLVATIGMKMNLSEVFQNLGLFAIGAIWMLVHVILLLVVARVIRAPFFFVAVGSQANIGGAASAPVVATAFSPSLAPVGVLLAVLGYAVGTYGGLACAYLMQGVN